MTVLQRRISKGGLAKQSAKGSAASAATYAFGVMAGSVLKVDPVDNPIPLTWSTRTVQGMDRSAVKSSAPLNLMATPAVTGLVMLGALGADAVTGSGDPYTHTITTANDLPYLTAFGRLDVEYAKLVDCKVSSLEVAWQDAGMVSLKTDIPGITPSFLASAYTETNQELVASVGYFVAAGGTFNVEGAAAQIVSGSVKIDNKVEQPIVSGAVTPADVIPGERTVVYTLKAIPADLGLFREVVFGSSSTLSTVAVSPYYGAVDLKFIQGATHSLEIASTRCQFAVVFPDSNPSGGPAEVTLVATVVEPASGSSVTATVINAVPAY